MKFIKNKIVLFSLILVVAVILALGISQYLTLQKAHSTFENYYTFRGCAQLLKRTADYGICKTNSGRTIKIVKFQNKWYLENDLPGWIF